MIWDTFLFYNELDMLECRFTELDDVVDKFVLVESTTTFQGNPKPLYYADNRERFAAWNDKIVHIIADDIPQWSNTGKFYREQAFHRESCQREYIGEALKDADGSDIVLLSDVDEIPFPHMIHDRLYTGVVLSMYMHMFAVDWLHPDAWSGTTVQRLCGITSFEVMRNFRRGWPRVLNAGHHLTYIGGKDFLEQKLSSYSHPELKEVTLRQWGKGGLDAGLGFNCGGVDTEEELWVQQSPCEVDDSYPRWIREGKCPKNWFRPRGE